MNTRRLLFLLPISLLGYLTFFYLFPRLNTSATWGHELDRATALEKARQAAERFDFDVNGCIAAVESEFDRNVEFYLRNYPNGKFGSILTAVETPVRFVDFQGRRNFRAALNSRGELLGLERRRRESPPAPKPETQGQSQPTPISEADRNLALGVAEKALGQVLGVHSNLFVGPPTISQDRNGLRFNWVASDEQLRVIAEVSVHDGRATVVKVSPAPTTRFRGLMESRQSKGVKTLSILDGLILWPSLIAVIIAYFIGLARRQINHRRTLLFLLICLGFTVFATSLGSLLDDLRGGNIQFNGGKPPVILERSLPLALFGLFNLSLAAGLYFLYAAGSSLYNERTGLRALDLALAIKGKLLTAPVAQSFIGGLLAGGAFCAIPYLLAASPLSSGMMISGDGLEKSFVSRAPALVSFATLGLYPIFVVFGFLAPLIAALISRFSVEKWAMFLCVWLTLAGTTPSTFNLPGALIASLLSACLLFWVYSRFGVLSVWITIMASQAAITAASLLIQANDALRTSGWRIIAGFAVLGVVGLIGLWKARPVQPNELSRDLVGLETQAERERLKAEFDVAARAQQHMLPDAPPALPGLRISAVCLPSKEVGGDLYDFLSLPNGKVGVVVADVSGKGVPASLYMTLTKGLLDSISEEKSDPGEILREANRHLYETCKRKMFVTLFLGVIDPISRTMTYARAGHNPTIFRRPSEPSTTVLKSRGMGLGLNQGKLFDQSLRVESLLLAPGDKLFFYSDGITEAMNRKNEEYGEERLMAAAAETDQMTAVEARDSILSNVSAFLSGTSPQDDQTLIVVEVTA